MNFCIKKKSATALAVINFRRHLPKLEIYNYWLNKLK